MKKYSIIVAVFLIVVQLQAQVEPEAGTWKTWFITSGKDYRLSAPSSYKNEIAEVLSRQQNLDATARQQIIFWNAGAPGYRWQEMMNKLWAVDTGRYAILANMLLGTAIYDATIAAWDTKYAYKRPRPFTADSRIKVYTVKPESPSYPCEHSVAAGVAVTIFSKFFPKLADSVSRLAQQLIDSRIAAGVAFPSDTRAGFDLGKRIAEKEIEHTKDFVTTAQWDGKVPDKPGLWRGKFAMFPTAGQNRTVVLESASEFRPGPPPDFAKEMEEMKNYKQTFRSLSNAFYWANQSWFMDNLPKKMFEQNLQLNPPRAARINAIVNVASYDAFVACWDAKFTYWGIRPSQYDTTFRPAILMTPPFPGYPSGHAAISGTMAEIYSHFFPAEKELFHQKAKEAAESRFQAGIHFRTDNDVALELGRKVAIKVLERVKNDGADNTLTTTNQKKTVAKNDN
ncbi:MAG TPA: vanadium-dependent haloperoxidase [Chitinophagaceae bacterium]|nr:vanadium-dependent haloperoxidase [Chitinophagaceae bacterium]